MASAAPAEVSAGGPGPTDVDAGAPDPLVARRLHVRAAVAALKDALAGAGATYLRNVEKWEAALDHTATALPGFPRAVRSAADRLPFSPPEARAAHHAFVCAIEEARRLTRTGASADGNQATDEHVAPADPLVARQRLGRAAVATLMGALGADAPTYRAHLGEWERGLDPKAPKLAALSPGLKDCGKRLKASLARAAHEAFVKEIARVRVHFPSKAAMPQRVRDISLKASLSDVVRGPPPFPLPLCSAPSACATTFDFVCACRGLRVAVFRRAGATESLECPGCSRLDQGVGACRGGQRAATGTARGRCRPGVRVCTRDLGQARWAT